MPGSEAADIIMSGVAESVPAVAVESKGDVAANSVAASNVSEQVTVLKEKLADDPSNFSTWTELLKLLEKDDVLSIDYICTSYDDFFKHFPLCFGFWNKYAEIVKRRKAGQEDVHALVCAIFERGTVACFHSVEMWVKYIGYLEAESAPVDERRAVFQRAMAAVEGDPTANIIWDKAIKFEYANYNYMEVTHIYKRLLANGCCGCASQTKAGYPFQATAYMEKYLSDFRTYAISQTLSSLASADQIEKVRSKIQTNHPASDPPVKDEEVKPKTDEELTEEVREVLIKEVEDVGRDTMTRLSTRTAFEGNITRSYFHTKPLHSVKGGKMDDKELANWREYLDYEAKNGNAKSTEKLYERCLIPLANYSEFWIRYSQWTEVQKSVKEGLAIIERATTVFLKGRADVHLHRALLLEVLGDAGGARETFEHILTTVAPGHLETLIKIANFERRQGNHQAVVKAYQDAISCGGDSTRPFLAMQLARFQDKSMHDLNAARSTYKAAVEAVRSNKNLWLGYIQFEFALDETNMYERVLAMFDDALGKAEADSCALSEGDQMEMWSRKLDFIEDYSLNVGDLREAEIAFAEWQSSLRIDSVAKKRRAEEELQNETATKLVKAEPTAATSVAAAQPAIRSAPTATSAAVATGTPQLTAEQQQAAQWVQYYQQQAANTQDPTQLATLQTQIKAWQDYYQQQTAAAGST